MNKSSKRSSFAILVILLSMIISSMAAALKGVLVPYWRSEFAINSTLIALIFTLETLTFMVATYLGGKVLNKLSIAKTFTLGLSILAGSLIVIGGSQSFTVLLVGMLIQGLGMGLISLSTNVIVPHFRVKSSAVLMSIVHFSFGLGIATAQRLSGYLLYLQIPWRSFYQVLSGLAVLLALFVFKAEFPRFRSAETSSSKSRKVIHDRASFMCLMICLGFYLVGEIGVSNWFVNYAVVGYGMNSNDSTFYLSLFFALFTFGRLVGGFVLNKVSYLLAITTTSIIAFVLILSGIWLGADGMILIAVAGLFEALVYPALMLVMAQIFVNNQAVATANIITGGYLIYLIINYAMGVANDHMGVVSSFYIIPISLLLCSAAALVLLLLNKAGKLEKSENINLSIKKEE